LLSHDLLAHFVLQVTLLAIRTISCNFILGSVMLPTPIQMAQNISGQSKCFFADRNDVIRLSLPFNEVVNVFSGISAMVSRLQIAGNTVET
jgi:hypothetical protein